MASLRSSTSTVCPLLAFVLIACRSSVTLPDGEGGEGGFGTPTATRQSSSGIFSSRASSSSGIFSSSRSSTSSSSGRASSSTSSSTSASSSSRSSSSSSDGCPPFANNGVYVNADSSVGADDACCGRWSTAGFGGPCLTLTHAMTVVPTGGAITVTPDAHGNANAAETYPIRLGRGVRVYSSGVASGNWDPPPNVAFPGSAGKNVFEVGQDSVDPYGTGVSLLGMIIGTDSEGHSSGARDGVYVGPGGDFAQLSSCTIQGVVNGVHVDGGSLLGPDYVTIQDVSGAGVLCQSNTDPALVSTLELYAGTISSAASYDVFASTQCKLHLMAETLGAQGPCPSPKTDAVGVYIEDNATVNVSGSTIGCMNQDGVSVRNNPSLHTGLPTVELYGDTITHSGCVGLYAETGTVLSRGNTLSNNHWGAIQKSALSSTSYGDALLDLDGGNQFTCNNASEPGACCTASSCPSGFDLWNNSGLPIDARNNLWDVAPLGVCSCDSQSKNCTCSGWAGTSGTQPPNDLEVLMSPLATAKTGTPTVDTTGAQVVSSSLCK